MNLRQHLTLLTQAIFAWVVFWLVGLPRYYQQYSSVTLGVLSILLSVLISLAAVYLLGRVRPERRMSWAFWYSLYFTLPLMALDTLYCGIWLGLGSSYLMQYWYLSIFYLTPWLTFPPTAWLLGVAKPSDRPLAGP